MPWSAIQSYQYFFFIFESTFISSTIVNYCVIQNSKPMMLNFVCIMLSSVLKNNISVVSEWYSVLFVFDSLLWL